MGAGQVNLLSAIPRGSIPEEEGEPRGRKKRRKVTIIFSQPLVEVRGKKRTRAGGGPVGL